MPDARGSPQDALVIVGSGAEAELALDAAPEVGRPHQIAIGVTDSPAECERVRRAAGRRARQRDGQVGDEREPRRTTGPAESGKPVIDGAKGRPAECVIPSRRVDFRQKSGVHDGQGATAVAGRREGARRDPYAGPGHGNALWRASDRDGTDDRPGPGVDAVEGGGE